MIKNERQYLSAKRQVDLCQRALDAPLAGRNPTAKKWNDRANREQIAVLEREIADYEALKNGARRSSVAGGDLGSLLIQARIARGWTQRELGDRLGLKMQAIADYEARDYARASLTRIQEVMQALGVVPTFTLALVDEASDFEETPKVASAKR